MKKSIADKWVKALRSGDYKQGTYRLHNKKDNTYCCLGVLCDVLKIKSADDAVIQSYENPLKSPTGIILEVYARMTTLNDSGFYDPYIDHKVKPLTFDEIADVIQMTWEDL